MSKINAILFDIKESIDDLGIEIIQMQETIQAIQKQVREFSKPNDKK